jgi:uncharacterized membrane protein (DUF2068 family)
MPRTRRERAKSDSLPTRRNSDGVIVAIAVFKLIKAALLVAAGIGLVEAMKGRIDLTALTRVLTPARMKLASAGAFAYAALFLTEGSGLLLRKRWAHWLTIVATASLMPFEIYEIVKQVTPLRIGALIVNAAVVAYLIVKVKRGGGVSESNQPFDASAPKQRF